jgi:ubiquinone/menaquinone biosynthesis C-methylase UbiE
MKGKAYYKFWRRISGAASMAARKRFFGLFMKVMLPEEGMKVLDVGVTGDKITQADNYFEKFYPWPSNITAVGVEDASYLETEYPGLKFVKTDGKRLPFGDKSFDIVFSSAVLEHVGSRENQKKFLFELARVGKKVFITTPNRFFPIEVHTGIPFLHYLPPNTYRRILKLIGLDYFSREENLNLLSKKDLIGLLPDKDMQVIKNSVSLIAYSKR